MSLADTLTEFIHSAKPGDRAREVMRQSIYDWMACGIAGTKEPVALLMRAQALDEGGAPAARLFGGEDVPARAAALTNGTISHALDYDDTHFDHIGHTSVAVCSAVMASAGNKSGEDIQDAALIGSELAVRLGVWSGRAHYQIGFHQTATAGALGATAAVCRLNGLSEDQTKHAMGVAATKAAGLKSQFGTMGKPLNAGLAAECGVVSAGLASRGFVSNPDAIDGPQGFGPTHHGAEDTSAFDALGSDWTMERVSHKLHACCHGLHAMIEALRSTEAVAGEVESVAITTHPRWMTVCNVTEPSTGLAAKFSYRQAAAMVLSDLNTADIQNFSAAMATDEYLSNLRQSVSVVADDRVAETASRVSVRFKDGRTVNAEHDLLTSIPLDRKWALLRRKGQALVGEREEALYNATARQVDPGALLNLMPS